MVLLRRLYGRQSFRSYNFVARKWCWETGLKIRSFERLLRPSEQLFQRYGKSNEICKMVQAFSSLLSSHMSACDYYRCVLDRLRCLQSYERKSSPHNAYSQINYHTFACFRNIANKLVRKLGYFQLSHGSKHLTDFNSHRLV